MTPTTKAPQGEGGGEGKDVVALAKELASEMQPLAIRDYITETASQKLADAYFTGGPVTLTAEQAKALFNYTEDVACFGVRARTLLPELVREVERLKAENEKARADFWRSSNADSGELRRLCQQRDDYRNALNREKAKNNRLAEIVAKLPATADGVPITPEMVVYDSIMGCRETTADSVTFCGIWQGLSLHSNARNLYSTREAAAAVAAAKAGAGGVLAPGLEPGTKDL